MSLAMVTIETEMSFDKHLLVLENDTASPDDKLSAFECLGRYMIQILKNKEDVDSSLFNDEIKLKHFVEVLEQYINSPSESLMLSALTVLEHGLTLLQPKMEESSVVHVGTCCLDVLQQKSVDILNNIDVPLKFFKCLCKLHNSSFNTLFQDKPKYDLAIELIKRCWDYSVSEKNIEDDMRICTVLKIKSLALFIKLTAIVDNTFCESALKEDFEFWLLRLFPSMFVDEDEVRQLALESIKGLQIRVGSLSHRDLNCWPKLKDDLKILYSKQLLKFAEYNKPDWSALWCFILDFLGDELHLKQNNQLINCLLEAEEKAFKSVCTETRRGAFLCWKHLIDKFLAPNSDDVTRRLKLLMQPMTANNSKTDVMSRVKLEVWWHLMICLEPVMERHADVVLHFLRFSFGPLGDTPLLAFTLVDLPKGSPIGTPCSVRRASNFMMKPMVLSPGRRFSILHTPCADALAQILTTNYDSCKINFLLPNFSTPLISNPMMFLKLSKMLIHSVGECTLLLVNSETRVPLNYMLYIDHLWQSLMNHIIASLKLPRLYECTNEKITEMVRDLLKLLQNMVEVSVNNPNLAQVCLSPVLYTVLLGDNALPTDVLVSQMYHVGTEDLMFGTPLLLMVDLFVSPSLLILEAKQPKYITFLQYILKMGIGPAESTIAFTQAVMKRLEIAINVDRTLTKASTIGVLWNIVARLLATFVGIGRDINQGTPDMRDYKCLYTVLMFPIQHVDICLLAVQGMPKETKESFPASVVKETEMLQLQKTWSHLFQAFQTNIFTDTHAASRLETNELCEQLCYKVLQELWKHSNMSCRELTCIAALITEAIRLIPYTDLNVNVSVNSSKLNINVPNQPWHGLKNTVLLLQKVSEGLKCSKDTEDSYVNLAILLAKSMSILMLNVDHFVIASALCSELLDNIHFLLKIKLNDLCPDTHDFKIHILKLWMDYMKLVTDIWNKEDIYNLQALLPLFETTLRHSVAEIRCHTLKLFKDVFLKICLTQNVTLPDSLQEAVNECPEGDGILRDYCKEDVKIISARGVEVCASPTESLKALQGSDSEEEPIDLTSTGGGIDDQNIENLATKLPLTPNSNEEIKELITISSPHKEVAVASNLKKEEPVTASAFVMNKRALTAHQREMRRRRRDDIPALYSDLTQDSQNSTLSEASQDNSQFTIPERFKTVPRTDSTTSVTKTVDHPFSPIFTEKMKSTLPMENAKITSRSKRRQKHNIDIAELKPISLNSTIDNESLKGQNDKDMLAIVSDKSNPKGNVILSSGKCKTSPSGGSVKSIKNVLSSANIDVTSVKISLGTLNSTKDVKSFNTRNSISSDTTIKSSVAKYAESTVTLSPRNFKSSASIPSITVVKPYSSKPGTILSIDECTPSASMKKPSIESCELTPETNITVQNLNKVEEGLKLSKINIKDCDMISPVKVVVERLHFDNVDISEAVRKKLESKFTSSSSDKISPSHRRKLTKPKKKNMEELKSRGRRSRKSKRSKPTDPVEMNLAKLFDKEVDISDNIPLKYVKPTANLEDILQGDDYEVDSECPLSSVSIKTIEESPDSEVLETSTVQSLEMSNVERSSKLEKSKKGGTSTVQSLEMSNVKRSSKLEKSKKGVHSNIKTISKSYKKTRSCITEVDIKKEFSPLILSTKHSRKSLNYDNTVEVNKKLVSASDRKLASIDMSCVAYKSTKSKRGLKKDKNRMNESPKVTRAQTCIAYDNLKEEPSDLNSTSMLSKEPLDNQFTSSDYNMNQNSELTKVDGKSEKVKDIECDQTKISKSPVKSHLQSCNIEVDNKECGDQNLNLKLSKKSINDNTDISGERLAGNLFASKNKVDVAKIDHKIELNIIQTSPRKKRDVGKMDVGNKHIESTFKFICKGEINADHIKQYSNETTTPKSSQKLNDSSRNTDKVDKPIENMLEPIDQTSGMVKEGQQDVKNKISEASSKSLNKTLQPEVNNKTETFTEQVVDVDVLIEDVGIEESSTSEVNATAKKDQRDKSKLPIVDTSTVSGENALLKEKDIPSKMRTRMSRQSQQIPRKSNVKKTLVSEHLGDLHSSSMISKKTKEQNVELEESAHMKVRPLSKRLRSKTTRLLEGFHSPSSKCTEKTCTVTHYSGKTEKDIELRTTKKYEINQLSDSKIQVIDARGTDVVTSKLSKYIGSNLENWVIRSPNKGQSEDESSVKVKNLTQENEMIDTDDKQILKLNNRSLNLHMDNSPLPETTKGHPVSIEYKTKSRMIKNELSNNLDESSADVSAKTLLESTRKSNNSKVKRPENTFETSKEEVHQRKRKVAASVIADTEERIIDDVIETRDVLSVNKYCVDMNGTRDDSCHTPEMEDVIDSSQDLNISTSSIVKECRITLHKIPWLTSPTILSSTIPFHEEERNLKLMKQPVGISTNIEKVNNSSEKFPLEGLDSSNADVKKEEQSLSGSAADSEINIFQNSEDSKKSKNGAVMLVSDVSNNDSILSTAIDADDKSEMLTKTKVSKRRSKLCGLPRELKNLEIAFRAECGGLTHESDKKPESILQGLNTSLEPLTRRKKECILISRDTKLKLNDSESSAKPQFVDTKVNLEYSKSNQSDVCDKPVMQDINEKMLSPKKRGVSKKIFNEPPGNESPLEIMNSLGDTANEEKIETGLKIKKDNPPASVNLSAHLTDDLTHLKDSDDSCTVTKDEIITKSKRQKTPKASKVDIQKSEEVALKSDIVIAPNIGLKKKISGEGEVNKTLKTVNMKKTNDAQNIKSAIASKSSSEGLDLKQTESLKVAVVKNAIDHKQIHLEVGNHETQVQSMGENMKNSELENDSKGKVEQSILSFRKCQNMNELDSNHSLNEINDCIVDQQNIKKTMQQSLKRKLMVPSKMSTKKSKMTKVETILETKLPVEIVVEPNQMKIWTNSDSFTHAVCKSHDNVDESTEESDMFALQKVVENKDAKQESSVLFTGMEDLDVSTRKAAEQMSRFPERLESSGSYLMDNISPSKMKLSPMHRQNVKHSSVRAAHLVGLAVGEDKWGGRVRWCDESEMIRANSEPEEMEGENWADGTDSTEGQSDISRDFKEDNQNNIASPLHMKTSLKHRHRHKYRFKLSSNAGKNPVLQRLDQELEDTVHKINSKGEINTFDWVKHDPVFPEFNPGPSILKRRKTTGVEVESELHSPTSKKKRLSFKDPEIIECLTFKRTEPNLHGGHSLRFRKDLSKDRKLKTIRHDQEAVNELCSIPERSESDSQGSVDELSPRLMDSQQPVYPSLKNCQYPIESIVNNLTDSIWVKALLLEMTQRNIHTVGDLCSLDETSVNHLPLKTPKIDNLKMVLGEYEKDLMASHELQHLHTLQQSQSLHNEGSLSIETIVDTIMSEPKSVDYLAMVLTRHCPASLLDRIGPDVLARHVAKNVGVSHVLAGYLATRPDASLLAHDIVDFVVNKLGATTNLTDVLPLECFLERLKNKDQLGLAIRQLSPDKLLAEAVAFYGGNTIIKNLFELESVHPKLAVTCSLNCLLPKVDKEVFFKHFSEEEHMSYIVEKCNVDNALNHVPMEKLMDCVCKRVMKEPLAQKSALNKLLSSCDTSTIAKNIPVDRLVDNTVAGGSETIPDTVDALTKALISRYSRETILNELPYESVVQFGLSKLELIDKIGLCTEAIKTNKDEMIPINVVKNLLSNMADSINQEDFVHMCFDVIKEKCITNKK